MKAPKLPDKVLPCESCTFCEQSIHLRVRRLICALERPGLPTIGVKCQSFWPRKKLA